MSVMISEQRGGDHDDDQVIVVTEAEFRAAAQQALDGLGMTYADLKAEAARGNFSSAKAHALWVSIGGTVDL